MNNLNGVGLGLIIHWILLGISGMTMMIIMLNVEIEPKIQTTTTQMITAIIYGLHKHMECVYLIVFAVCVCVCMFGAWLLCVHVSFCVMCWIAWIDMRHSYIIKAQKLFFFFLCGSLFLIFFSFHIFACRVDVCSCCCPHTPAHLLSMSRLLSVFVSLSVHRVYLCLLC